MGSFLTCTCFWTLEGATKASLLIPWQRFACSLAQLARDVFFSLLQRVPGSCTEQELKCACNARFTTLYSSCTNSIIYWPTNKPIYWAFSQPNRFKVKLLKKQNIQASKQTNKQKIIDTNNNIYTILHCERDILLPRVHLDLAKKISFKQRCVKMVLSLLASSLRPKTLSSPPPVPYRTTNGPIEKKLHTTPCWLLPQESSITRIITMVIDPKPSLVVDPTEWVHLSRILPRYVVFVNLLFTEQLWNIITLKDF